MECWEAAAGPGGIGIGVGGSIWELLAPKIHLGWVIAWAIFGCVFHGDWGNRPGLGFLYFAMLK